MKRVTRIVALSGSLRSLSSNTALLREIAALKPAGVTVEIVSLGALPLFNPDLETDLPEAVVAFRGRIAAADALIIASPEYAHGISSVIKNTLDWLVASEDFSGIPVAVLNLAPRAHHADAALRETLSTMAAKIVEDASITIRPPKFALSTDRPFDPVVSELLADALRALIAAARRTVARAMNDELHNDTRGHDFNQCVSTNKGTGQ